MGTVAVVGGIEEALAVARAVGSVIEVAEVVVEVSLCLSICLGLDAEVNFKVASATVVEGVVDVEPPEAEAPQEVVPGVEEEVLEAVRKEARRS